VSGETRHFWKESLCVVLTLLISARPVAAQTGGEGIGIGVEAMAAFPNLRDASAGLEAKTGYGFGLWVGGNRDGRVGFVGEFIYLVKTIEGSGSTSAKRHALQIPAVFHFNFGSRNRNNAMGYGVLGPVFTLNVKEKLTGGFTGNNFAGADIGVAAGAGFEIARVGIEGRGNWSLRNISEEGTTTTTTGKEVTFELLGKFRFN
jgi:hypothetical protein